MSPAIHIEWVVRCSLSKLVKEGKFVEDERRKITKTNLQKEEDFPTWKSRSVQERCDSACLDYACANK